MAVVRGNVLRVDVSKMPQRFRLPANIPAYLPVIAAGLVIVFIILPALPRIFEGLLSLFFSLLLLFVIVNVMLSMGGGMMGGRTGMPNPLGIATTVFRSISRVFGSLLRMGQGTGPRREISVHNITVADRSSGRKVLVRIEGDITAGHVSTGDDIEVEGSEQTGTVLFRRGVNHSLGLSAGGTQIVVHRPWW